MRNRIPIMLLWTIGIITIALTLHVPVLVETTLVFGAVVGILRTWRPAIRFIVSLSLIAVVVLFSPSTLSIVLQIFMALVALGEARSARLAPNRTIIGALLMVTIATFIHPEAAFAFLGVGIIGILALLTGEDTDESLAHDRTRLGFTLALIASAGAIVAALILSILPWQSIVANVFAVLAYPFIALLSRISIGHHRLRKPSTPPTPLSSTRHALGQHSQIPTTLSTAFIILGILALIAILYGAYRYWSSADPTIGALEDEDIILRESLSLTERRSPWRSRLHRLGPVRSLVRSRLSQARRKKQERLAAETLNEWILRVRPDLDNHLIIQIYNQIRYGGATDTPEAREQVESRWPRS